MMSFRLCLVISLVVLTGAFAADDPFDSTTDSVGWKTNGYETPVNQFLSPAGIQVQLPGVRPNALALSPDGRRIAASGLKAELLVLDAHSLDDLSRGRI